MSSSDDEGPFSSGAAFLLWLGWLFGFGGLHRFYLKQPVRGVIYLLTFGLFFIGQVYDLMHLGDLVERANAKAKRLPKPERRRSLPPPQPAPAPAAPAPAAPSDPREQMRRQLLLAAKKHHGNLTVSQGVMETGKSFEEVEGVLDEMAKSGYVGIDNDPHTGVVIYTFGELS